MVSVPLPPGHWKTNVCLVVINHCQLSLEFSERLIGHGFAALFFQTLPHLSPAGLVRGSRRPSRGAMGYQSQRNSADHQRMPEDVCAHTAWSGSFHVPFNRADPDHVRFLAIHLRKKSSHRTPKRTAPRAHKKIMFELAVDHALVRPCHAWTGPSQSSRSSAAGQAPPHARPAITRQKTPDLRATLECAARARAAFAEPKSAPHRGADRAQVRGSQTADRALHGLARRRESAQPQGSSRLPPCEMPPPLVPRCPSTGSWA